MSTTGIIDIEARFYAEAESLVPEAQIILMRWWIFGPDVGLRWKQWRRIVLSPPAIRL